MKLEHEALSIDPPIKVVENSSRGKSKIQIDGVFFQMYIYPHENEATLKMSLWLDASWTRLRFFGDI